MLWEFAYNDHRYQDALDLAQKLAKEHGSFLWNLKSCQLLFELGYIEEAGKIAKEIRHKFPYDIARNDLLQLDLIRLYYYWSIADLEAIRARIAPVHKYSKSVDNRKPQNIWSKAVYYNLHANLLAEDGNFEDAVNAFDRSLELKRKLKNSGFISVTLNDLGLVLIKQGQLVKAIQTLTKARERLEKVEGFEPLARKIQGNLGIAHRFFNNIELAEKYLMKARNPEISPIDINYFAYSFHLMKLYQDNNNFDRAILIYNEMNSHRDKLSGTEANALYFQSLYYQLYQNKIRD